MWKKLVKSAEVVLSKQFADDFDLDEVSLQRFNPNIHVYAINGEFRLRGDYEDLKNLQKELLNLKREPLVNPGKRQKLDSDGRENWCGKSYTDKSIQVQLPCSMGCSVGDATITNPTSSTKRSYYKTEPGPKHFFPREFNDTNDKRVPIETYKIHNYDNDDGFILSRRDVGLESGSASAVFDVRCRVERDGHDGGSSCGSYVMATESSKTSDEEEKSFSIISESMMDTEDDEMTLGGDARADEFDLSRTLRSSVPVGSFSIIDDHESRDVLDRNSVGLLSWVNFIKEEESKRGNKTFSSTMSVVESPAGNIRRTNTSRILPSTIGDPRLASPPSCDE